MSNTEKGPTPMETVIGGSEFEVTLRNGSKEKVFVRQLSIEHWPKLLSVQDDESKMIELYCDKPKAWASQLTLESQEQLIAEGERINLDPFSRWLQRRIARQERLMPGITQKINQATEAAISASTTTLPKSSQPPD